MVKKSGFTIVELLVFITILSLFFVTAAAVTVSSLRNIKTNEHRVLATRYAEELREWVRAKKEADWNDFTQYMPSLLQTKAYCFQTTPIDPDGQWPDSSELSACSKTGLEPAIYARRIVFSKISDSEYSAAITVSWSEGGRDYNVTVNTHYAIWE